MRKTIYKATQSQILYNAKIKKKRNESRKRHKNKIKEEKNEKK